MTDACTIEYKGHKYIFQNNTDEPSYMFIDRCWFIAKHSRYFSKNECEALSHAYVNIKHLGVEYEKIIMDKLKNVIYV
uniref:XRN2-binding (XTBD) domain-containing protein n=1 Tax=viral metagenome TaxID=1070528 RepID=A0A6C0BGI8_9ZZZZ